MLIWKLTKDFGLEAGYLSKIVEEKKLERDFIISKYDDLLYVLRTQKTCKPLYEIIIRELSALILHPVTRDIFYSNFYRRISSESG